MTAKKTPKRSTDPCTHKKVCTYCGSFIESNSVSLHGGDRSTLSTIVPAISAIAACPEVKARLRKLRGKWIVFSGVRLLAWAESLDALRATARHFAPETAVVFSHIDAIPKDTPELP